MTNGNVTHSMNPGLVEALRRDNGEGNVLGAFWISVALRIFTHCQSGRLMKFRSQKRDCCDAIHLQAIMVIRRVFFFSKFMNSWLTLKIRGWGRRRRSTPKRRLKKKTTFLFIHFYAKLANKRSRKRENNTGMEPYAWISVIITFKCAILMQLFACQMKSRNVFHHLHVHNLLSSQDSLRRNSCVSYLGYLHPQEFR